MWGVVRLGGAIHSRKPPTPLASRLRSKREGKATYSSTLQKLTNHLTTSGGTRQVTAQAHYGGVGFISQTFLAVEIIKGHARLDKYLLLHNSTRAALTDIMSLVQHVEGENRMLLQPKSI